MVARYHDGNALVAVEPLEERAHLHDAAGVEAVRGLVEDQHLRLAQKSHRQTKTLLHAQGQRAAYEATAVLAQEGRMMMEAKIDQDVIPQLAQQKTVDQPAQLGIQFLPEVGPDISWTGGEMSIRYEMDKLNFDWRMNQMQFTFVPGDIEFKVTQQPDVVIKYIGGPLYVPPSADPNYEPLDTKA